MATSLAKQLKKLQIPGQSGLLEKESSRKPSLLFTAKEAANLDIDSIHALGVNGLEELITLQPAFSEFTESLFAESCKQFERSIEVQSVIKELDNLITKFLRLLSPYFLLRPAHKCLEWLIRAFRIHECNTDVILECILPYYETNLFVRVVQLLPIKDPSSTWHWLHPLRKEGTPLSHLTLIQHCLSNPAFLSFIFNMVSQSLTLHKDKMESSVCVLISFYVSTITHVLERGPITEELISRLLPYLLKGLKSSNLDFRAGSYMIVSLLASKVTLDKKLTMSLLECIIKNFGPSLKEEAISCIIVLCARAECLEYLPDKTLKYIFTKKDSFFPVLESISNLCDPSSFLTPLLRSLIVEYFQTLSQDGSEVAVDLILQTFKNIELTETTVTDTIKCLIDHYLQDYKGLPRELPSLQQLAQSIDSKYPSILDTILQSYIKVKGDKKVLKALQKFITLALPGSRHELIPGTGETLVLTLHHSDPSIRASAVNHLSRVLTSGCGDSTHHDYDKEFISSAILARLNDDSPLVVMETLQLEAKLLLTYCDDKDRLLKSLIDLLSRKKLTRCSKDWQSCILASVSLLTSEQFCESYSDELDNVVLAILPLMLLGYYGNNECSHILKIVSESPLSKCHPLFKNLNTISVNKEWSSLLSLDNSANDTQLLSTCLIQLITHLAYVLVAMETQILTNLVHKLISLLDDTSDLMTHFLVVPLLGIALETGGHTHHLQLAMPLSKYLLKQAQLSNIDNSTPLSATPTLNSILEPLMQKHIKGVINTSHTHLLLWLINQLVQYTISPTELSQTLWLYPPTGDMGGTNNEQLYYYIILSLFVILAQWSDKDETAGITNRSRQLLQELFKVHFPGRGALLRFLAMIWTIPISDPQCNVAIVTETVQLQALKIAACYIRAMSHDQVTALLSNYCPVVSSLLLPLASPYQILRKGAMKCLQTLHQTARHSDPVLLPDLYASSPLLYLLDVINERKVELVADPGTLKLMFGHLMTKEGGAISKYIPETPGGRRKSRKKAELRAQNSILESILDSLLLMVFALDSPPDYVQYQLMIILTEVDHKSKLLGMLTRLKDFINQVKEYAVTMETEEVSYPLSSYEAEIFQLIIACYTPAIGSWLEAELETFELFLSLLTYFTPLSPSHPSPAVMALKQITAKFYQSLSSTHLQQTILQSIIDLMTTSTVSTIIVLSQQCLQQLPLNSEMLITELLRQEDHLKPTKVEATPSKRTRKSRAPVESKDKSVDAVLLSWKRVTAILEVIQNRCCDIEECHLLVSCLFSLLSWCFETKELEKEREGDCLEYTQQLILSSLLDLCITVSNKGLHHIQELLPESQFNVEQIVQCLRHSSNPHTQHSALLLLSTAAKIFPTRILHNLMPIFTFMGTNLLRHDDSYTFQVINKTLDTVIPTLLELNSTVVSSKKRRYSTKATPTSLPPLLASVTEIIRVFVDAIPHIPAHRQLPLLSHLLHTVGPTQYLYLALGMLSEKSVIQSTMEKTKVPKETLLDSQLLVSLSQQFSFSDQLGAMQNLLQYNATLPQQKPQNPHDLRNLSANVTYIFNVSLHSDKHLRQYKYATLSFMAAILGKLRKDKMVDNMESTSKESIMSLLQECLHYLGQLNKYKGTSSNASSVKYWDSMIAKIYDVINKVVSLMSVSDFLEVLLQLLHTEDDTQRKAIDILNRKLEDSQWTINKEQELSLLEFVDILMGVASNESVAMVTRQTALYSIKLTVSKLGDSHKIKFIEVANSLIAFIKGVELLHPLVHANTLLCLAEICHTLSAHVIPLLPKIVPLVLVVIDTTMEKHELLHLSAVTSLRIIVETLPKFLSSFMETIVQKVCCTELVAEGIKETTGIVKEATQLRDILAHNVPSRVFLPALYKTIPEVMMTYDKAGILALITMLKTAIDGLKKQEVNQQILVDIFKTLLEYRVMCSDQKHVTDVDILEVESSMNEAFTELVIKLSEASFRPLFLKLLGWATNSGVPDDRILTFYHLTKCIALKLKTLFLLFAGHLVDNISSMLEVCNISLKGSLPFKDSSYLSSKCKTRLCLELLLDTLHVCFLHDKGSFVTKERFQSLMKPLIDQICNTLGDMAGYRSYIETHLLPCIAQFAVAAGKESRWKPLNRHLLLKTRDINPQVRLYTLKIAEAMYSKLGEEFIVLLPETIPFLAELMEDESIEVEQQTHITIATIEGIMGESIQHHF